MLCQARASRRTCRTGAIYRTNERRSRRAGCQQDPLQLPEQVQQDHENGERDEGGRPFSRRVGGEDHAPARISGRCPGQINRSRMTSARTNQRGNRRVSEGQRAITATQYLVGERVEYFAPFCFLAARLARSPSSCLSPCPPVRIPSARNGAGIGKKHDEGKGDREKRAGYAQQVGDGEELTLHALPSTGSCRWGRDSGPETRGAIVLAVFPGAQSRVIDSSGSRCCPPELFADPADVAPALVAISSFGVGQNSIP